MRNRIHIAARFSLSLWLLAGAVACLSLASGDRLFGLRSAAAQDDRLKASSAVATGPALAENPTKANTILPSRKYGIEIDFGVVAPRKLPPLSVAAILPDNPRQVGVSRKVNLLTVDNGRLFHNPDGTRLRVLSITASGAIGLRFHFENFDLPPGDEVYVYGVSADSRVEGPFTGKGKFGDGEFWTGTIDGETLFIEHLIKDKDEERGFRITELVHQYKSSIATSQNATPTEPNLLSCHVDASCNNAQEKNSVGRITYIDNGSEWVCSGTLLNTKPTTFIPYFLTANHCVSTQTVARTVEVYWFYQTTACNSGVLRNNIVHQTAGASLQATSRSEDSTLIKFLSQAPSGTWFSGWDANEIAANTQVLGLHHPDGGTPPSLISYLRASTGTITTIDAGCSASGLVNGYALNWDSGASEPGSSGSGLWRAGNEEHYLIGVASCGPKPASCVNRSASYGKLSNFFPLIRQYLRPAITPNYVGYVDQLDCNVIRGWAADRNWLNISINVSIYDGATLVTTVLANQSRPDVGAYLGDNGLHGFNIPTPASLKNGAAHNINVRFETSNTDLIGSPDSITCANLCTVRTPISIGQSLTGSLTGSDCKSSEGRYVDYYAFNGVSSQQVAISLDSTAFDAYLELLDSGGNVIDYDDDGGDGVNARIPADSGFFTLPATGVYTIAATSFRADSTGSYNLRLIAPTGCYRTYHVDAANNSWLDTGMDAIAGQSLSLTASGTAQVDGRVYTDPNGYLHTQWGQQSRINGELSGKIGTDGQSFTVGASFQGIAPRTGRLYLIISDFTGYRNNSGGFDVCLVGCSGAKFNSPALTGPGDGQSNVGSIVNVGGVNYARVTLNWALNASTSVADSWLTIRDLSTNRLVFNQNLGSAQTHTINLLPNGQYRWGIRAMPRTTANCVSDEVSRTFTTTIAQHPIPSLVSISPNSATVGGGAFTLTVNGSGFVNNSVVRWNGNDRATTLVSGAQLTAQIPATDIAVAGAASVTVFNPTPGGGLSNPLTFTITQYASGVFINENFNNSPAQASFNDAAVYDSVRGEARLTPNAGYKRGSIFFTPTTLIDRFTATFQMRIDGQNGADGMTFAVIESGANSLGAVGAGLGYENIPGRSFAVEFDTYFNGELDQSSAPHVGLNVNGSVASIATGGLPAIQGQGNLTVRVVFDRGVVQVFLPEKQAGPVLNGTISNWTPFTGRFGFTAATGGYSQIHAVDSVVVDVQSAPLCAFELSAASQLFPAAGGVGTVSVRAPGGCAWTAARNVAWITIISGASGVGDGLVSYSVDPNNSSSQRTGTMTIAEKTFTVTQDGVYNPPPTLALSFNGKMRDRVGQGEIALSPDGSPDGAFTVTISPGGGTRTVTSLDLRRSGGGQWNTTFGDGLWALGAADSSDAPLLNTPNGAVSFPIAGGGSFVLFASDYSNNLFNPGDNFTLTVNFADGTSSIATATIQAPPLALSFSGKTRDRVGAGDTALNPDGFPDGVFTATLLAGAGTRNVVSLDLTRSNGGRWNTVFGDGLWTLGAAGSLDAPLFNNFNSTVSFFVAGGGSFYLFASDNNNSLFNPGDSFTLTVNFADGTTVTASATVPASSVRAGNSSNSVYRAGER